LHTNAPLLSLARALLMLLGSLRAPLSYATTTPSPNRSRPLARPHIAAVLFGLGVGLADWGIGRQIWMDSRLLFAFEVIMVLSTFSQKFLYFFNSLHLCPPTWMQVLRSKRRERYLNSDMCLALQCYALAQ
jgi:hypothetical protein